MHLLQVCFAKIETNISAQKHGQNARRTAVFFVFLKCISLRSSDKIFK